MQGYLTNNKKTKQIIKYIQILNISRVQMLSDYIKKGIWMELINLVSPQYWLLSKL